MRAPTEAPAKPMADPSAISPLRDLQYRLEYVGLRILIGFVRFFPIDVAGSISLRSVSPFASTGSPRSH